MNDSGFARGRLILLAVLVPLTAVAFAVVTAVTAFLACGISG